MTAKITIRNRPSALQVMKTDGSTGEPLADVHFSLYKQVKANDGTVRKDYLPMTGYEDLQTDADGILNEITMALPKGTYYLTENQAPEGYEPLAEDLCFTLEQDGTVSVNNESSSGWLSSRTDAETGTKTYILNVPNLKLKKVSFKKVDIADIENSALEGAVFDLYRVVNGEREETPICRLTSGSDGMLADNGETIFKLPAGTYQLVECAAPAGYMLREPVTVEISSTGVTYDDGTNTSRNGAGVRYDEETDTYTLLITNSSGYELPLTGGPGTGLLRTIGVALVFGSAGLMLLRKRRNRASCCN